MKSVTLHRRILGFSLIALSGVSLLLASSGPAATQADIPQATSTTFKTRLKQGYASEELSLRLESFMPSINDAARFLSGSVTLAEDGPLPKRSDLLSPLSRSATLVSGLRGGWVRAFWSKSGVVSVSVLSVSSTSKPVKAYPEDLSATLYGKDASPGNLPLPAADWLSHAPGEIILKRGEFVIWVRSSSLSTSVLSSMASMTAQQVSMDASSRKSGSTDSHRGRAAKFDLPEILPSYPDRDTVFPVGSSLCILFRQSWTISTCPV